MRVYVTKLTFPNGYPPLLMVFDEYNWNLAKSATFLKESNAKFLALFGSEQMLSIQAKLKGWRIVETHTVKSDKTPQELLEK